MFWQYFRVIEEGHAVPADWYTPSEKDGNHPPLRTFWMGLGKTPSYILGVGKGMELDSHFAAKHSKLTIRA